MRNRLDCLWHNGIVCRNHKDHDVGNLCTARTHGRKRRVARRIKERQLCAAFGRYLIGTDVLGNAPSLASNNVGFADRVQQ